MTAAKRSGKAAQREETQRRLVEAAAALLETTSLMELSATDITARAGFSNAAFYVYFTDVYDILLVASGAIAQSPPELLALFDEPWSAASAPARAARLVEGYFAIWDRHRPILRARNLAADEGRPEFVKQRQLTIRPLVSALEQQIRRCQARDMIPAAIQPLPLAHALLALLERTGAVRRDYQGAGSQWERDYSGGVVHILLCALGFKKGA